MQVIICEPGKLPAITDIPNELGAMQAAVGGYIEVVAIEPRAVIVCNEEGRLRGLPENRLGIVGTFFICGVKGDKFVSLSQKATKRILGILEKYGGTKS